MARVLDQLEELLPIRRFLPAEASDNRKLRPNRLFPRQLSSFAHVPEILTFGDGAMPGLTRAAPGTALLYDA
jgi:hypothetical protein